MFYSRLFGLAGTGVALGEPTEDSDQFGRLGDLEVAVDEAYEQGQGAEAIG